MKVTFIMPAIGRKRKGSYVKSWQMEPLAIAVLSALTPPAVEREFFDDRQDEIPEDVQTDLVAMSVETYTARRAYQIARRFRKRGVPVVMGGFHPTLVPDEVGRYADAVVIGDAEPVWGDVLRDAAGGTLQPRYHGGHRGEVPAARPDRDIFAGKRYPGLSLVETARGCRYHCEFCSITRFYGATYRPRPVADVIAEIRTLKNRNVFFVDDNLGADRDRLRRLLTALVELDFPIRWFSQISIDAADDPELLDLMRRSGCVCVLIGFESLEAENLARMGKRVNRSGSDFDAAISRLRRHGISVYGTFVFGYDADTPAAFDRTLDFAVRNQMFFAAFNHLVPFPGTAVYERLRDEGRVEPNWWLSERYRFGQVAFQPRNLRPDELEDLCFSYRQKFYDPRNILRRGMDRRANCASLFKAAVFFIYNVLSLREVRERQMLPLGVSWEEGP